MNKKILALGASTSNKSINKQLASYFATHLKDIKGEVLDLNDYPMPIFDVDDEAKNGSPQKANELSLLFDEADGFIVSLAEHNGSYSAAFKNIYDWLSRINKKVWRDKPMLLLSTSPGGRGGKTVLEAAKASFPFMGAQITGTFSLPSFYDNFDPETGLKNEQHKADMIRQINAFEQKVSAE